MTEQSSRHAAAVPATTAPGVAAVTRLVPARHHAAGRPGLEGSLALAATGAPRGAVPPSGRPDLRVVDGAQARTRAWAVRFFQSLVEVIGGDRNPHQLLRCTSPEVFEALSRRCEVVNRFTRRTQQQRRVRAQVRSVHVCQPTPSVAEVCARVEQGGRSRAVAARLELVEGRWLCTALEIG